MPVYNYKCTACEQNQEEIHPMAAIPLKTQCQSCGADTKKTLSQVRVQLKGYGFPGKEMKEKNYRTARHAEMGRKQKEAHGEASKVMPNVEGEICDTWSDAARLAEEKGKDVASYERKATETT